MRQPTPYMLLAAVAVTCAAYAALFKAVVGWAASLFR